MSQEKSNVILSDLTLVELEDEGYVAAGRTIPFPAPEGTTLVGLSPEVATLARQSLVKTMTVYGNSLEGAGLYDGDKIIVRKAFSTAEISLDTICIVRLTETGDVVAKKVKRSGVDALLLRSFNKDVPDMEVPIDDANIRGIVIGLYRKADRRGRFDRGYEDDIPF